MRRDDDGSDGDREDRGDDEGSAARHEGGRDRSNGHNDRPLPVQAVRAALRQLAALTGRSPDTVSGVERDEDGWRVTLELVELERIPASTNVLATYEARIDDEGNVLGYQRLRRYVRSRADDGE